MPDRTYQIRGGSARGPAYKRVMAGLSNAELLDELQLGKGDAEFQQAVREECIARGILKEKGAERE